MYYFKSAVLLFAYSGAATIGPVDSGDGVCIESVLLLHTRTRTYHGKTTQNTKQHKTHTRT